VYSYGKSQEDSNRFLVAATLSCFHLHQDMSTAPGLWTYTNIFAGNKLLSPNKMSS